MKDMAQRIAIKAVLVHDGKVLILRKANYEGNNNTQGKWNLPGGRIEPGETWQEALRREIAEEAGIVQFDIGRPLYIGEWHPNISGVPTQIICTFLLCATSTDVVRLNDEHDDYAWIRPSDRKKYPLLPPEGEVIDTYEQSSNEVLQN